MASRAIVYIDYENAYRHAREFFHNDEPGHDRTNGHFKPRALAEALCEEYARKFPARESLEITSVKVFRGRPVQRYEPEAASAWNRQAKAWKEDGISLTHAWLHYDEGGGRPREKGIDILLALHVFRDAVAGSCDVAILFSRDSDFESVFKFVRSLPSPHPVVLTAGWRSGSKHSALPHPRAEQLLIDPSTYNESCADTAQYFIQHHGRPRTKAQKRGGKRQGGKKRSC